MQRGEIWWANLPKPAGKRPVLVLSMDKAIGVRTSVTVAQVTQVIRNIPTEVALGPSDGLPKRCVVNTDVVLTLSKEVFSERVCALTADKLKAVSRALQFAMDL
jgi:mRNA interferase MazF